MAQQVFDLEALTKDGDFMAQLSDVASSIVKSGKSKGWAMESISASELSENGDVARTYVSVKSKTLFDGNVVRFSAVCSNGVCTVSYVNATNPEAEQLRTKGMY